MDFKSLFHDLASVVEHLVNSSGLDQQTRTALGAKIDNVKAAAGSVVSTTEDAAVSTYKAAPTVAGALASEATTAAMSKVPGGDLFAGVLSMVAQAAATLAVSHFQASLEAHNGDHLAAAQSALDSITAAASTVVTSKGEPDSEAPPPPVYP